MGKTTELRHELKRRFLPALERAGFELDLSDAPRLFRFRRMDTTEAHILEIQWEKYGRPRFVLNFGRCPSSGVYVRGEHFPIERVLAGWLKDGGRLQPKSGAGVGSWFRQDKPLIMRLFSSEKLFPVAAVVDEVLTLYPEIEGYWSHGQIGPHLRISSHGI